MVFCNKIRPLQCSGSGSAMLRRIAAAKSVAETSVHDDVMDAVRRMQLAIRDGTSKQ